MLLEAVEGDRGGQHAGPDSRLGGVFLAHAACNAGDRSTILGVALPPWQTDPDHTAGDLMPDDRDARLAELHRFGSSDLLAVPAIVLDDLSQDSAEPDGVIAGWSHDLWVAAPSCRSDRGDGVAGPGPAEDPMVEA
jgi:hypothetical protein